MEREASVLPSSAVILKSQVQGDALPHLPLRTKVDRDTLPNLGRVADPHPSTKDVRSLERVVVPIGRGRSASKLLS